MTLNIFEFIFIRDIGLYFSSFSSFSSFFFFPFSPSSSLIWLYLILILELNWFCREVWENASSDYLLLIILKGLASGVLLNSPRVLLWTHLVLNFQLECFLLLFQPPICYECFLVIDFFFISFWWLGWVQKFFQPFMFSSLVEYTVFF